MIQFAAVTVMPVTSVPAAHITNHSYTFQDNGTITIGREAEAGGCVVWLSEVGGANTVNNFDLGRQVQIAVREGPCHPNPTQAGDGFIPSNSEIFYVHSNYVFSKCVPMLFRNFGSCTVQPPPGVAETEQRMYMWHEFLPDSGGRALLLRSYWTNTDSYPGASSGQQITPAVYHNWSQFEHIRYYSGEKPWTGGALSTAVDALGNESHFLMTEQWSAMVDTNGWGVAHMSENGRFRTKFFDGAPSGSGDHENDIKTNTHEQRFCMRTNPGEAVQTRESRDIFYIGDVIDARWFFSTYRPVACGSYAADFDDGQFFDWERNSNPIQITNGEVVMGPDPDWVNELALVDRYWTNANYEVDVKLASGEQLYGIVFRKQGQQHFWDEVSGYYMAYFQKTGSRWAIQLWSKLEGQVESLQLPLAFQPSDWHHLKVTTAGGRIGVYVDGNLAYTWNDVDTGNGVVVAYGGGYFSLMTHPENVVHFDNLSITAAGDERPADPASNASASLTGSPAKVQLDWTNPSDSDWRWTRVVRKTGTTPTHPRDGYPVYEGKLSSYIDADAPSGSTYYYSVYTVDHAGNYSAPVTVTATP